MYKWITKTLTLRLEKVVDKLILTTQSAFIKGKNIMNGVMALHEILHETKWNKELGVILKLDFKKAYEKVNWDFLFIIWNLGAFVKRGALGLKRCSLVEQFCVKLNNKEGSYFASYKGVRRGVSYLRLFSTSWMTVWLGWWVQPRIMDGFVA